MPSIGRLDVSIVLDNPGRPHHGHLDPVTGRLVVKYVPSSKNQSNELFGPLKCVVLFEGRAKTKIFQRRGAGPARPNNATVYRGRVPLFATFWRVHDGTVKIGAMQTQSFPFTVFFPDRANQVGGDWEPDPYFASTGALPPSFTMDYQGFAHRFEAFTAYTIGATVEMPGLDIKISEAPVCHTTYSGPKLPLQQAVRSNMDYHGIFVVQNERLLLEENRPKGFKQKTKAIFNSSQFPRWAADIHISVPQHLYLDERISFEVALRQRPGTNVQLVPDISLAEFEIILSGLTLVRAERGFFTVPHSEGNQNYAVFHGRGDKPFSKAEDFVKRCQTLPIVKIPHTFSCTNITTSYSLNVRIVVTGAGEKQTIERGFPVYLHPPIEGAAPAAGPSAGPSPAAVPSAAPPVAQEELPAYTSPPSYDASATAPSQAPPPRLGSNDVNKTAAGVPEAERGVS